MPRRDDISRVMVIGSGPIIIGQAAEFDYAGTQACRTLKEEGFYVVLVNSNPATIMTDPDMADRVYLEPLQIEVVQRLLLEEKIDGLLASLGGQTGLNLAMELAESGFLQTHKIQLMGTASEGIKKGEDREDFLAAMTKINQPCIPSQTAQTVEECLKIAQEIGYPVIVRPAFTLGGTGGGIVKNADELKDLAPTGLSVSRVHQVLIEKSIAGWQEIEFEAIRDDKGQKIAVCSMENFDPVGVHTGDSIVIAPAQTLNAKDLAMLRQASLDIVEELKIQGGCNVQFAKHPTTSQYAVIEVNPRLSRSSALASKASGYPIAKIASKIACGYTLDEIKNPSAGWETALFEPELDYIVVKIPKFPFDKFVKAKRTLGTQMKATGEVMSLGDCFESALMKAIRSMELNISGLFVKVIADLSDEDIWKRLEVVDDMRLFVLAEALRRNFDLETLYRQTMVERYFLAKIKTLVDLEERLLDCKKTRKWPDTKLLEQCICFSFTDSYLSFLTGQDKEAFYVYRKEHNLRFRFQQVNTYPGKKSTTPYYYSDLVGKNQSFPSEKPKIVVFGSGPIRIGQGIEFDYCSVHCVWALQKQGYEAIIINNNPETVSTDFDTGDKLYFEPLTIDDVREILDNEQPVGCVCQFGGQTAIKLIQAVSDLGYPILGTAPDMVDAAEDREKFDQILENCGIKRPEGSTIFTDEEAVNVANKLTYPVLVRPSYVLGGQGMAIVNSDEELLEYLSIINLNRQDHPILIDKYLRGTELEVDAVCDGKSVLIPGIMEHLERAGVHSGDSISIFPAYVSDRVRDIVVSYTEKLALALEVKGLINIQFILFNDEVYVIEVNPRSSRTVPYISKVTGIPIVDLATQAMLGIPLADQDYKTGLYARYPAVYAVKVPVFSFEKLQDVDVNLGPEMKSTGEVLGLSTTYPQAMYKAILASGFKFPQKGDGVLLTVRDSDKSELLPLAEKLNSLGFEIYGTLGTANYLNRAGIPANSIRKIEEAKPNSQSYVENGIIKLLVNTETGSASMLNNGFRLRRICIEHGVPTITSLDTLSAVVACLESQLTVETIGLNELSHFSDIVKRTRHHHLPASLQ